MKKTLWALLMLILSAALGTAALAAEGLLRVMLIAGCLVYGIGAGLTLAFDVTMYVQRWRSRRAEVRLPLVTGLRDSQCRRHPTMAWEVWREEAPWMTGVPALLAAHPRDLPAVHPGWRFSCRRCPPPPPLTD